jgi:hypothetical protein
VKRARFSGLVAVSLTTTTEGEGVLATPDDVKAQGPDVVAAQKKAWAELTPANLIFELCFREEQQGEASDSRSPAAP